MEGSPNYPAGEPGAAPRPGGASEEDSKASRALESVGEHTREVTAHAAGEARGVIEEAVDRLREQAERQTEQVHEAVQRTGEQLEALADGRVEDAGPVADYARRAATKVNEIADRMGGLGFDGVVSEVSGYARRRPGRFLLAAAGAGLLAGRLGRNARSASRNGGAAQRGNQPDRPALRDVAGTERPDDTPQVDLLPEDQPGEVAGQGPPVAGGVPSGFGTDPAPVGPEAGEPRHG